MIQNTVIPVDTLKYISRPILENIAKDIIISKSDNPELKTIHESFCEAVVKLIGDRRVFFVDDARRVLMNIIYSDDLFFKYGDMIIDHIIQWVNSELTHYEKEHIRRVTNILRAIILSKQCQQASCIVIDESYQYQLEGI